MTKTIYIVLTSTGSVLSRAIKTFTNDHFNHISLAFDEELQEMYSFGRKKENNPWIGGFVQESPHGRLLRSAYCAIYAYPITDEQYIKLRRKIDYFKRHREQYRYNFIGLLCVACRIRLKREHAYFCSQFIATLFRDANIEKNLCPYFTRPTEFEELPKANIIYLGYLEDYICSYTAPQAVSW